MESSVKEVPWLERKGAALTNTWENWPLFSWSWWDKGDHVNETLSPHHWAYSLSYTAAALRMWEFNQSSYSVG